MTIAILHTNQEQVTMSSIELVDYINSQRDDFEAELRHDHFMAKVPKVLGKDAPKFWGTSFYKGNGAAMQERATYTFPKREACLMAMSYSYDLQAKVFDKMTALESGQAKPAALSTMDILTLAMESEKGRLEAVAQLALAAPKVAFVEKYVESMGLRGFREVCKVLSANEARFREFVLGEKIMYRLGGTLMPAAQHMDAGRFVVKTGASEDGHSFNTAKFTTKGVEWVAGLWAVHGLRVAL
jgi:phage antirepressor YoqD-like protein